MAAVLLLLLLLLSWHSGAAEYCSRGGDWPTVEYALADSDLVVGVDGSSSSIWVGSTAAGNATIIWQTAAWDSGALSWAQGRRHVYQNGGTFFFEHEAQTQCSDAWLCFPARLSDDGQTVLLRGHWADCGGVGVQLWFDVALTMRASVSRRQVQLHVDVAGAQNSSGGEAATVTGSWSSQPYQQLTVAWLSSSDEGFYGFGEQYSYVNMKGRRLPLFVREQGVGRGLQPLTWWQNAAHDGNGGDWSTTYTRLGFYLTSLQRAFYVRSQQYCVFDLRAAERVTLSLDSARLAATIVDGTGTTPLDLIAEWTLYAGRMAPPPAWTSAGVIVGVEGGSERVQSAVAQAVAAGVPVAAAWMQDWCGARDFGDRIGLWWNWQLDGQLYANWTGMLADWRRQGIRALTYVNPMLVNVSAYAGQAPNYTTVYFDEALRRGYLVRQRHDGSVWLGYGQAALLDLTNPAAARWYRDVLVSSVLAVGSSGFMLDFGEALPLTAQLHTASSDDADAEHDSYPARWQAVANAAFAASTDSEQLFYWSRSAGQRSVGVAQSFWLGDQLLSWDGHDGLASAVNALLSGGLSGMAVTHSDVGGYTNAAAPGGYNYTRSKQLFLRWCEFGAFSGAVFRTHPGSQPLWNWQFNSDQHTLQLFARAARAFVAWAELRAELLLQASRTGAPLARHLLLHYSADPAVYHIDDQYLLGSDLMVAPVLHPDHTARAVYFPLSAATWRNVWTGARYAAGASYAVPAPLGSPPVFVRSDSPWADRLAARFQSV